MRRTAPATKAKRKPLEPPPAMPEPDLEPEPPAPSQDQPEDGPAPITKPQMKMLHASFNEAGVTERDARLAYCSKIVGRELETSNDLTKDEASRCIDALTQDADQSWTEGEPNG